ncbi:MAG: exo-alpha-sialidase [Thermoplasmata archaeon]|nr:MAG: exo-alpha-sialidase [Thermoplasmata archaeon]
MILTKRNAGTGIVLLLILGIFSALPNSEHLELAGNAGADYVGFVEDVQVNDDTTDQEQSSVAMATYNDYIYLVWHDMRNGDFDIYFSKSTNSGQTWGDGVNNNNDIRVDDTDRNLNYTDNETLQKYPDIAVDSAGVIYVIWQDTREGRSDSDLYMAKSSDGGNTFGDNFRVDDNGTGPYDQIHPCMEIDENDNIYVVWEDERNSKTDYDIYFTNSSDSGVTFSPNVLVDDDTSLRLQKSPRLAVKVEGATTEIYVVWQDERRAPTNYDIMFSKSTDGGKTWGDGLDNDNDIEINDMVVSAQEHPSIALDSNGHIFVTWDDEREENYKNIYMSNSTDGGATWSTNWNITDYATGTSDQTHPVVSAYNNYMTIAWIDNRHGVAQSDVFFALSDDNGATFGPFLIVNQGASESIASTPDVILAGPTTAYIAWEDTRDENRGRDIYFAKSGMIKLKAPTLSGSAFTPETGKTQTQFHFTVVYTDEEDDAPALDYPKLYLFKDSEGTEPYPGSPFIMHRQIGPWNDGNHFNGEIYEQYITLYEEYDYHYYITAKANYGNQTEVKTNLTKGPVLDLSNVTFSNGFPSGDEWHNSARVKCGISIRDVGEAGVDPLYTLYRISVNGTDNFGDWKNDAKLNRTITSWGVNVSREIYFEEGVKNYIQWSGMDKFGNGPNVSAIYNIKIDKTPVTYTNPTPDPEHILWYNDETVDVSVTVNDIGASGVNASTIEYSYSTSGLSGYGNWINAGKTVDGESVSASAKLTFVNGSNNYIKWRAYDLVGNGPAESEDYKVRIDTTLKHLRENHPPTVPENVMPQSTVDRQPRITWNHSTDEDGDPITYWIQIGTTENGSEFLAWTDVGSEPFYQVKNNLNVGTYYIKLKAYDGFDFSARKLTPLIITTTGNTPPSPPTQIDPQYTFEVRPRISWSGASDAEGDTLYYFIQIGTDVGADDILILTSVGYNDYYEYKQQNLAYGIYHITIIVFDGKDWSEQAYFTMKIADYYLDLRTESPISIKQAESKTLVLTLTNMGNSEDEIILSYSDILAGKANLTFSNNNIRLGPGANTTLDLTIDVFPDAETGDYYLKLIATSEDGISDTEFTVIVTITERAGTGPGNGDIDIGDDDDDDDLENKGLENFLKGSFFWLIIIIIIIVVIVAVYLGTKGRREKEKAKEREEYDKMYEKPAEQLPPDYASADYGGYDEGALAPPGGEPWAYEGLEGGIPPEQALPPAEGEYYDDYYGTAQGDVPAQEPQVVQPEIEPPVQTGQHPEGYVEPEVPSEPTQAAPEQPDEPQQEQPEVDGAGGTQPQPPPQQPPQPQQDAQQAAQPPPTQPPPSAPTPAEQKTRVKKQV